MLVPCPGDEGVAVVAAQRGIGSLSIQPTCVAKWKNEEKQPNSVAGVVSWTSRWRAPR